MKETLLRFTLGDVLAVRVTCGRRVNGDPCSGVVEVAVDQLFRFKRCPVCGDDLPDANANALGKLMHAVQGVNALPDDVLRVEFVLPAEVADEATG